MINGHIDGSRKVFPLFLRCALSVVLFLALADGVALAQTPHSVARTCGSAGESSCPTPLPITGPWKWGGSIGANTIPDTVHSLADVTVWWTSLMANGSFACSTTQTGQTEQPGFPVYQSYWDGLESTDEWNLSYQSTIETTDNPPCQRITNASGTIEKGRTLACPLGTTPTGEPVQCVPSGTPNALKQQGRCKCKGKTVKTDPVDVSDGNNYVNEVDYEGFGERALKFERSYNSISANTYLYKPNNSAYLMVMGIGWSATYFQYLMPVSVTENGVTSTTVYAYRPDGRVLGFTFYNGVYSPDGDVNDSLVQTSGGGWQYQTSDDTIETYNANGQLISIARRGEAPVTVNYASGASPGDPPISVSDAFGHTLQFSYLVDSTSVQRLASITDPSGKTIKYAYNSSGDLSSVTYQDGTKRSYTYDNNYALLSITDESNVAYRSWTYTDSDAEVATSQSAGGVGDYTYSY